MASSPSTLTLPLGYGCRKNLSSNHHPSIFSGKIRGLAVKCSNSALRVEKSRNKGYWNEVNSLKRREVIGLVSGVSSLLFIPPFSANGAGLPPEEKPKLCDDACEKELENVPMVTTESGLQYKDIKVGKGPSPPIGFQVAANYVAMVPSGQVFDSSLEKGQLYIFRVGSGQVIKGLDEGILSMKTGGKRRLYIPGSLAFPKGLTSAPGRPRVAPSSPVIFDVSLEYIPGLEEEEE
ncbi:peptidyl-prolyl cis-trans isomerase FKBP16-3, chloroplastic [Ziziphus jujuba]|uniref:peptidylprolyl isomerase n=1 Tax=Ziziphus jujuba TaxID=326968 RepID=A0A6P3YXD9_ZIZJJ|nr:peptidyl-prolyl cis-trans isomerase FKBP16-3, chloroplastic [Ziziphus jujuba]